MIELLTSGGANSCTFKGVADAAGVERSTLYRRYPDRWAMMVDAIAHFTSIDVAPDLGDSFAHDLASVLRKLRDTLDSPLGPAVMTVAAAVRAGVGSDYSKVFFDQRMEQLAPMFDAAIRRGELPPDVDRKGLFSFAAGPIWYRTSIASWGADEIFCGSSSMPFARHIARPARPNWTRPTRATKALPAGEAHVRNGVQASLGTGHRAGPSGAGSSFPAGGVGR